eukprot:CAMPEP_0115159726 /NCGR_PEP_ID=MMETSP0227-20121206/70404_1 /TAXON_ID=89957 /ORGANISM="Polarella glacialis, Strain CCMP 1383" /LENGTH=395 /DNA_ID=CAMNT_0002571533 /DNA_START=78 /DNA_END=1265 /DNA_ORIENTATION=-
MFSFCCESSERKDSVWEIDDPDSRFAIDCGFEVSGGNSAEDRTYKVTLDKNKGGKLGLDVDFLAPRKVLPIVRCSEGGLAELWNKENPSKQISRGDCIMEVNGTRDDSSMMLEKCKKDVVLELVLSKKHNYEFLIQDLENLVRTKKCGPIFIRLSWHDAGVFSTGKLSGGCPNAAMRLAGGGEAAFDANAGLPTVGLTLLKPISDKYCPSLISHADLWALASNVAIRCMGGPDIPVRFGRQDAMSASEGVESQVGRLPDGDKGAAHLRDIFGPKGFDDRAIVALSGAHTVGKCHVERSGFDGAWTEAPLKFDNSYFQEMLKKSYKEENTAKGNPQFRCPVTGTMMLISDLALIQEPGLKAHVERYAEDQEAFFNEFSQAWTKIQENGCMNLRPNL